MLGEAIVPLDRQELMRRAGEPHLELVVPLRRCVSGDVQLALALHGYPDVKPPAEDEETALGGAKNCVV